MSDARALVHRRDESRVAVLTIDHPPVNALSHGVRVALLEALDAAERDPAVDAIVIAGASRVFVAGADLREFDAPPREPVLSTVLDRIEACRKPVVAAMDGLALGGGLELALACHLRVAAAGARLGLPEVKLGLLPGAGGTVRLPRLVGSTLALEMMLGGDPIDAARAQASGLVDVFVSRGPVIEAAAQVARRLGWQSDAPTRGSERDPEITARRTRDLRPAEPISADVEQEALRRHRRALRGSDAGRQILQCLNAAATLSAEDALQAARRAFVACRDSPASRALRHLFFAERAAGRMPTEGYDVKRVAVIGAGTMGSGIAIALADAKLPVTVVDVDEAALERSRAALGAHYRSQVERGRMVGEEADERIRHVSFALSLEAIDDADFVIEAAIEDLEVKRRIFAELDARLPPSAVLATNTSYLDVDRIAAATRRADRVVGLHFFSPANVMRLVEVVRTASTGETAMATAVALARRLRKLPILVGNATGFVGNRMLQAYGRESQFLLLEGATPAQVDRALEAFGMAMGPCAVYDLAGLDVGWRARRQRPDRPDDPRWFRVADALVEAGRLGQKSGAGHYHYAGRGERAEDPFVLELIEAEAARLGVTRRTVTDAEIVERCVLALVVEGRALIAAGVARCAADIDVVWANGYGFPRWRGGPMFWADQSRPADIDIRIAALAKEFGAQYWSTHRPVSPHERPTDNLRNEA